MTEEQKAVIAVLQKEILTKSESLKAGVEKTAVEEKIKVLKATILKLNERLKTQSDEIIIHKAMALGGESEKVSIEPTEKEVQAVVDLLKEEA